MPRARLRLQGPPPVLSHHISTVHPMPVHMIQYGKALQLQVPVSEPRRFLFGEEDRHTHYNAHARLMEQDVC